MVREHKEDSCVLTPCVLFMQQLQRRETGQLFDISQITKLETKTNFTDICQSNEAIITM